jgi:RHS repeat-associated protein
VPARLRWTSRDDSTELQFHGLASSTLATVDTTSGAVNAAFLYAPFGEVLETRGTQTATHRRRMNDKYQDAASGLGYYGFRYYDNVAMQWTQSDPLYRFKPDAVLHEPRRASLYSFVLQNPNRYSDPDGRNALELLNRPDVGAAAIATGGTVVAAIVAVAAVEGVQAIGEAIGDAIDSYEPPPPGTGFQASNAIGFAAQASSSIAAANAAVVGWNAAAAMSKPGNTATVQAVPSAPPVPTTIAPPGDHRGDMTEAHRAQRKGDVDDLIQKEQDIKKAYPDQAAGKTGQAIRTKLKDME